MSHVHIVSDFYSQVFNAPLGVYVSVIYINSKSFYLLGQLLPFCVLLFKKENNQARYSELSNIWGKIQLSGTN